MFMESLRYCQQQKGLQLHAYVIMSNHVHLVISVKDGYNISNFVRDCKKFTAKQILEYVEQNDTESRRTWMLH